MIINYKVPIKYVLKYNMHKEMYTFSPKEKMIIEHGIDNSILRFNASILIRDGDCIGYIRKISTTSGEIIYYIDPKYNCSELKFSSRFGKFKAARSLKDFINKE